MRRTLPRPVLCAIEQLETRKLMHGDGVTVTPTHVIAGEDIVPRFAAEATFIAVKDGDWSDPLVWNRRSVPAAGALVRIPHEMDIEYDLNSTIEIDAIEVSGRLDFDPTMYTALFLNELMVMPDGVLTIGTNLRPITSNVSAKIVFTDTPGTNGLHFKTGTLENPGIDPQQWGNGLLVFGRVEMHGQEKTSSYIRLQQEPRRGDTVLVLESAPTGWRVGDQLVLPDTNPGWDANRVEELVIRSISGNRVTLQTPLAHDHLGARSNGVLNYLPHVGNLTRNVLLTSENPNGVRGHTAFFADADVNLRYARFSHLGRTLNSALDNTEFEEDHPHERVVTRIGMNQVGRYSLHIHHVTGPENPENTGYQFTIVGNALDNGLRWGMAIHGASYGQIESNFVYNMVGAGIATEDGTEAYNRIANNFVVRTTGRGLFKEGLAGEAFWIRGPLNVILGNVAANSNRAAFDIFEQHLPKLMPRPRFRDADPGSENDNEMLNFQGLPWQWFCDNEVYGSDAAFDSWFSIPDQRQYVRDFVVWHTNDNNFVLSSYVNSNVFIDGFEVYGNVAGVSATRAQRFQPIPEVGIRAVRQSSNMIVRNSMIIGVQTGIETPAIAVDRMTIQDTTIQAYVGVRVGRLTKGSVSGADPDLSYGSLTIENTKFLRMPENLVEPQQYSITLDFDTAYDRGGNLLATNEVFVYDYNGVSGQNFRIYYPEQAPNFLVPTSVIAADPRFSFIASPEIGLTNFQLWQKYGVAVGGSVAPSREIDGDNGEAALARGRALGILGMVFPILTPQAAPKVNAGGDFAAIQYQTVNLTGSVSTGATGDWSKVVGPGDVAFGDFRDGASSASFSEPGVYILRFTGTAGSRRAFDDVVVNVASAQGPFNRAPSVNAGPDTTLMTTASLKLQGLVEDDGRPQATLSSRWRQISGPGAVTFFNPTSPISDVRFPSKGTYVLELTASDGQREASDRVSIVVERVLPQSPLLGLWKMDSNLNNVALDSSVHKLDGTVVGGRLVTGQFGSAIDFSNSHVVMPASDLLMPESAVTAAAWIRPRATADLMPIFSWDGGSWDAYKLSLQYLNGRASLLAEVTTNLGVNRFTFDAGNLPTTAWTHVALSFSNLNGGELKVLLNGAVIGERQGLGTQLTYRTGGTRQLYIGRDTGANRVSNFQGGIDELYVYNIALSAAQIQTLMLGANPLQQMAAMPVFGNSAGTSPIATAGSDFKGSDFDSVGPSPSMNLVVAPILSSAYLIESQSESVVPVGGGAEIGEFEAEFAERKESEVSFRIEPKSSSATSQTYTPLDYRADATDVNGDGVTSPLDAVLIINRLIALAEDVTSERNAVTNSEDVNGDNLISPLDALLVINKIKSARYAAEGEQSSALVYAASLQWFADLEDQKDREDGDDLFGTFKDYFSVRLDF